MAGAWRTAQKATSPALYWLVLSLITFLGMSAVIKIDATRMRLSLVVVVVGVAFSAACFLERLLRDYMRTDIQPNGEPSDVTGSLFKWLSRNKEHLGAKHRGKGERRAEPQTGAPHKPKQVYLTSKMSFDCFARRSNEPEAKEHSRENPR